MASLPWKVLVFPGNSEISYEINRSLRDCHAVEMFAAGMPIPSAMQDRFAHWDLCPSVHEDGWVEALQEIVVRRKIDFIIPAQDDVIVALTEVEALFSGKVVCSPAEVCRVSRSKRATYEVLADVVRVPSVLTPGRIDRFPIFAKPDRGEGAKRARRIDTPTALAEAMETETDLIFLEHLPGPEFTIDCFSDRERGVLYCRGRQRIVARYGVSVVTRSVENPEFFRMAEAISSKIPFHGAWFFQVKEAVDGTLALLEVAPRVGGAAALSRASGVNLTLLSLYEHARLPFAVHPKNIDIMLTRTLDNHYNIKDIKYTTVYCDFDDTLILKGKVNTRVVRFLYQCINRDIRIVLLTKCRQHLPTMLERHRLLGLFDEIIHITPNEKKSRYITDMNSIMLDDSFNERQEVETVSGILTFDPSTVECLIDDRA